jgi:PadR family transcriptional regulator, regulatory protein PadR
MGTSPRMTIPTQRVLAALLVEPQRELYGIEIGEAAGLPSGTVHPILARLEGIGWLESRWEDVEASTAGRPARRYYRFAPDGAGHARQALERAYRGRQTVGLRPVSQS